MVKKKITEWNLLGVDEVIGQTGDKQWMRTPLRRYVNENLVGERLSAQDLNGTAQTIQGIVMRVKLNAVNIKRGKLGNKWDIMVFGCSTAQSTERICLRLGTGRKTNCSSLHLMRINIQDIAKERKDDSSNSQRIWGRSKRGDNSDSKRQTMLSWKSH